MMTVAMRADGVVARISRAVALVPVNRSRCMGGFQLDGAGCRIDGRNTDEYGDEQREERRHDAMPVRRPNHAALYHGSVAEQ